MSHTRKESEEKFDDKAEAVEVSEQRVRPREDFLLFQSPDAIETIFGKFIIGECTEMARVIGHIAKFLRSLPVKNDVPNEDSDRYLATELIKSFRFLRNAMDEYASLEDDSLADYNAAYEHTLREKILLFKTKIDSLKEKLQLSEADQSRAHTRMNIGSAAAGGLVGACMGPVGCLLFGGWARAALEAGRQYTSASQISHHAQLQRGIELGERIIHGLGVQVNLLMLKAAPAPRFY